MKKVSALITADYALCLGTPRFKKKNVFSVPESLTHMFCLSSLWYYLVFLSAFHSTTASLKRNKKTTVIMCPQHSASSASLSAPKRRGKGKRRPYQKRLNY